MFNRANNLRLRCEFDKAQDIYEKIVAREPNDSEAYWEIILCKYGIEYVEDPTTLDRIPTCHRTQVESVLTDVDYLATIENADAIQTVFYENEAKEIDKLQKNILAIANNEKPFDVFICYKETDENGKRTVDSVIANDIYYQLTKEGFKVFYSAITLEDKLGQEYEPYIYAALNSAKVMLVVGTKPEYFNSVWTKNEWSRYLKIIKKDRNKLLIPCYKDMDAYDLPEEFSHLQAQNMGKIGFINDVIRGVQKYTSSINVSSEITPLIKRIFIFLENNEWNSADEYCEKVLDIDPENAQAYLGKLLAELHISKSDDLKYCSQPFVDSLNYKKLLKFADDDVISKLNSDIDYIKFTNLNKLYNSAVLEMKNANSEKSYNLVAEKFNKIIDFKDSNNKKIECIEQAKNARNKAIYESIKNTVVKFDERQNAIFVKDVNLLECAIQELYKIDNYSEATELIKECQRQINWVQNDYGTLNIMFLSNINDKNFNILIDEKVYQIGKITKKEKRVFRLSSGVHRVVVDNNLNYVADIEIKRNMKICCYISKNIFGDYIIKK